jgi:hypothetical protein
MELHHDELLVNSHVNLCIVDLMRSKYFESS